MLVFKISRKEMWFLDKDTAVNTKIKTNAMVTSTIRLRLDGRSTVYQRSFRSQ